MMLRSPQRYAARFTALLATLAIMAACAATPEQAAEAPRAGAYERTAHGIVVTPAEGPARKVRVEVYADDIMRVTAAPDGSLETPDSLMVIAEPAGDFQVEQSGDAVTVRTGKGAAQVSLATGLVSFRNAAGQTVLSEETRDAFAPVSINNENFYAIRQQFNRNTDEGLYGLGQHQNGQMNYNGENVELAQHNIVDVVPFLVSTRNYGILWDNNGLTRFGDPRPFAPLNAQLKVYDANGAEGGLTGRYYRNDDLVVTKTEADPNYQFLPADQFMRDPPVRGAFPAEFNNQSPTRVTWEGAIEANAAGVHKFQVYASSYIKVWVDDQLVVDRWRQNWNPWTYNFDLQMAPGEKHKVKVEWLPNDGYFRFLHLDPLPQAERHQISFQSDVAHALDYYVVLGDDMDDVIGGYRRLTGSAVMLPRWAYGFWQSRQRYTTQEELLGVVREYRRRHIPLDNIVMDWFYWKEDSWGSHEFDATRFPDPKGMVDEIHRRNAQIMISVWPKFYPTTRNYQELDRGGHIYRRQIDMRSKDWVGPGYANAFYDPYSAEARQIYWRQVRDNLGVLGIDAWWMDATEPDSHSNLSYEERALRMGPTAQGPGAEFFNSFVLKNSQAIYEGDQAMRGNARSFLLTRSTFGGLQRYGSASWSGDVASRWDDLREQISAGVNVSLSGLPNWTHDIGGFALEDRYTRQEPAHLAEWRELNMRWFQFGAFSPLFRSHGEAPPREIYNIAPNGSEVQNAMIWYDRLRYRLMPYVYTLAADTYHKHGTIMRGLVMDFPNDPNVRDIGEQYMFGPAFMVAPVTEFRARTRRTYLPAGTAWYDFYGGARYDGGQTIDAAAPLARMPLFVRAGSIVPTGPAVEYADQNPNGPLTLLVYASANGAFDIYEDDGRSNDYSRGAFSRIPVRYDDATGAVTIGARTGNYAGAAPERVINVRWISGPSRNASNLDARADRTVRYTGAELVVQRR